MDPGEAWPDDKLRAVSKDEATAPKNSLVNDAFHGDSSGFTTADAQRGDAALQILRFKRMQQRHDQACAGGADGMAERTGAAIDIQSVAGDTQIALRRHRYHRERLVDLEQIDVTNAPAHLVEQLADRRNRGCREPLRLLAVGGVALDLGKRREPVAIGERSPG